MDGEFIIAAITLSKNVRGDVEKVSRYWSAVRSVEHNNLVFRITFPVSLKLFLNEQKHVTE